MFEKTGGLQVGPSTTWSTHISAEHSQQHAILQNGLLLLVHTRC